MFSILPFILFQDGGSMSNNLRNAVIGLSMCVCSFVPVSASSGSLSKPLAISGIWSLTDQYSECTMTFTDSTFNWDRPSASISGSGIITYSDNASKTLIVKHTVHPDPSQVGGYFKLTWSPATPSDTALITTYMYYSTQDSALSATDIFPTDYPRKATKTSSQIKLRPYNTTYQQASTARMFCLFSQTRLASMDQFEIYDIKGRLIGLKQNNQSFLNAQSTQILVQVQRSPRQVITR
jgi:hypothetical protein